MNKIRLIAIYLIVIIIVLGVGFLLFKSSDKPKTDLPGQAFEIQGQVHLTQGSTDHPAYNSNPPTSGWHWPEEADWGIYTITQPDEQLIHNLEHGGIWISYQPDKVDANIINLLNDFARRYSKIIVEPRDKDDAPIVLAAWGRLEKLDQYDERLILEFIRAFYDQGPEKVD